MAQWRLIKKSIVVRCVMTWNFVMGITNRLARKLLVLTGWEARASAMYRGNSSTRNTHQANGSAQAYSIRPIILCIIGIAGFQPVILVFAAERCVPPAATRVVSVQGNVTWSIAGSAALEPAKLNDMLCVGDTVRVGTKSRAVLRLPNETTIPLDQNTVFQLKQPISEKEPTLIELIQGAIHVITRTPKPFKVNTPYMNAAVEGTEFYVGVDSEEARVAVIEGKVNVSNELGALLLTDNEAAIARQGQAPQRTLTIKPRDAVQWALYYPPLFDPRARPGAENLSASYELYSQGKITEGIESLEVIPVAERGADFYTYRAGLLLLVGRADEAEPGIEAALRNTSNNTDALSLKAIIAIVRNDKVKALELANQAVSIDDNSASARIALSYALQANFKIEEALKAAREATERDANNALAWARVAELELSIPNYDKSKQAAEQAVKLNPNLARTQSVLGFANLTRIDIKAAKESFNKAIELDQADPLPRLGLGLAVIRDGNLKEGREQIEIAASLDPENSLIRSYLGKAYYEEKRDNLAGAQFELAKERDPKDPTPYFYDSIRKQADNRPIEALMDLQTSVELNNNRAVYRSKLILDEDVASRSASLARIYQEAGFDQLALVEGYRSISSDPTDFAPHRFLADSYLGIPRHELAAASELLQSQLLQPVGVIPFQSQFSDGRRLILVGAGPTNASLNEFNPLFLKNGFLAQLSGLAGNFGTFGDQLLIAKLQGRYSMSFSQFHYETDGPRVGSDLSRSIYSFLTQAAIAPATSVQFEYRHHDSASGDVALRFDPTVQSFLLRDRQHLMRLGGSTRFAESLHVVGWLGYQSRDGETEFPRGTSFVTSTGKDTTLELQILGKTNVGSYVIGAGGIRTRGDTIFEGDASKAKLQSNNQYVYAHFDKLIPSFSIDLGLSRDRVADVSLTSPIKEVSPKFGVSWKPVASTTVRFASTKGLRRALLAGQTIEPTQIVGFNQLFDDSPGANLRQTSIAVDHKFSSSMFWGIELSKRSIRTPQVFTNPTLFYDWYERERQTYFYWTPANDISASLGYSFTRFERPFEFPGTESFTLVKTHKVPVSLNFFRATGLSLRLKSTHYRQTGNFFSFEFEPFEGTSEFWLTDVTISYRLPRRRGLLSVEVRNLFDKRFRFQETNFSIPTVSPRRMLLGRFDFSF